MYIPMVRERVRVAGRRGIHVVVFVDYRRCQADIRDVSDRQNVAKAVPFEQLFAIWEKMAQETSDHPPSADQDSSTVENHV